MTFKSSMAIISQIKRKKLFTKNNNKWNKNTNNKTNSKMYSHKRTNNNFKNSKMILIFKMISPNSSTQIEWLNSKLRLKKLSMGRCWKYREISMWERLLMRQLRTLFCCICIRTVINSVTWSINTYQQLLSNMVMWK